MLPILPWFICYYYYLRHLAVHVILGLDEPATVDLAGDGLAGHDVALGLGKRRVGLEMRAKVEK